MTREEAINILYGMRADNLNLNDLYTKDKYDALGMAIKALEQEPCEDAISRQAVLEQINCWIGSGEYKYTNATDYLTRRMQELPPVTPQPKTGHWIDDYDYNCNICGHSLLDIAHSIDYISFEKPKYCPNCGAKMIESEG